MSKIAIITGSAGNLGIAVTQKMAASGFTVIGTVEPGKQGQLQQENIIYESVDLTDQHSTKTFIEKVKHKHGKINAVICLVGGFAMSSMTDASHDDIMKMINLNFITAFNTIQPVINLVRSQKEIARIVLVGAKPVFDTKAAKAVFPYALSKSMVVKMAEAINADRRALNATASVIVPSIIDTPPNRESMPDADFGDWVKPESIAETIVFACGEGGRDLRETVLKVYGNS